MTTIDNSSQISLNNPSNRRNLRNNRRNNNIFNVHTNMTAHTKKRIFNVITLRNNANIRRSNNRNRRIRRNIRNNDSDTHNNININDNNTNNFNVNNNFNIINNTENMVNNNENIIEDWIMNLLPRSIVNNVDKLKEKECAICLGNFKVSEEIMSIPCFHMFHSYCIKQWLIREKICPICKFKITRESILN